MEYYKRSPFLLWYWNEQNKPVVYNYNRYTKAIVSKDIMKILEILPEWKSAEEILSILDHSDKKSITQAIRHLIRLNFIHRKPIAREDINTSHRTEWNAIELAMLRQMNYPDLFPESRNRNNPISPTKSVRGISSVILPKPKPTAQSGCTLSDLLYKRRTIRKYDRSFMDLNALSGFLFKCARVKTILKSRVLWGLTLTRRPYPSGGSRYPLEIYPVNNKIRGIEKGIYHYDPLRHKLALVNKNDDFRKRLNESILQRMGKLMNREPDVVFIITAVFARTMWKYKGISLSLIMSELGCLYQTMYLVATEMSLAPCPLGGTVYEELARDWLNLNWFEESQVGTFLLGTRTKP
jgi:SagB-type dehydrogenase family enzyme